jgi:hypothetical protein
MEGEGGDGTPMTGQVSQTMKNILGSLSSSNPTIQSYLSSLQASQGLPATTGASTTTSTSSTATNSATSSTTSTSPTGSTTSSQSQLETELMSIFGGGSSGSGNGLLGMLGLQNTQALNPSVMNLLTSQGFAI